MLRALLFAFLAAAAVAQVSDFAFVHASDTHAPLAESGRTISLIDPTAPFVFADGTAAARREFAVVTGDLTEFGGAAAGRAAWETYLGWWRPTGLRVYHAMGNHDATWDSLAPALREVQGGTNVAFEAHGCKFLVLDSTTPQDPRPEFGGHTLRFVREELARTAEATPLFVFFHHPPYGGEWAGPEAPRRLLRLLDGRALAGLFVGHHHTAWHRTIDGADVFGGASTFTKGASDVGWNVVAVKDRILRVAFHDAKGAGTSRHLLTKPLGLRYRFAPTPESRPASRPESHAASAAETVPTSRGRTVRPLIRRTRFDAAVRAVTVWPGGDGRLYLFGLGDGRLVALDENTLEPKWTVRTGGEIVGGPVIGSSDNRDPSWGVRPKFCVFAASDGFARSVGRDGAVLWSAPLDSPSHATPVLIGDVVVCATNAGRLVGLDVRTGARLWTTQAADYAIENLCAPRSGPLFFGAWDEHVRRFDPDRSWRTGARETWRAKSAGPASKKAAAKYWSPADAPIARGFGPGGTIRVVDRAYAYTRFDERTGTEVSHELAVGERGVAAVTVRANEEWVVRTDDVVERRHWYRGEVRVLRRFEIPTGTAPNPVVLLAPGAGVYVSPRGWAAYMVRNGVSWSGRLFEDTFVLGALAGCEPPRIPVEERDVDVGFGSLATRFVVGALDGSVAVVDLDARF
jgi:outer membrane protein assembly factor BamB